MTITRRERLRDATSREIREAARERLRAHGPGGISLRAIARDIGMTAPALYRYYTSLGDLIWAMREGYLEELRRTLEAARDAVPADDIGARLAATIRAFRRWAVEHRAEFAMVFGAPVPGFEGPATRTESPRLSFGAVFFALMAELWQRERYPVPSDEEISPALRAQLWRFVRNCGIDLNGVPLGVVRLLASAWIRLYGAVAMEVFGQLDFMFEDPEPIFEAELADFFRMLGYEPESPEA